LGITGAEMLVRCLEELGVDLVFGYPGGNILPVYDALIGSNIRHVLVRQEQGAVHAASGYARVTGKAGVCLATSGPGATNLVTGIATAYMDSIPLVVFTGQVPTIMVGTDAFQEVDITGITIPITKHNYLVKDVDELPRVIKEAFHIATTGRTGPVVVDLPKDVSSAVCKAKPPQEVELRGYKPNYQGHPTQIRNLARLIQEARRPVIYAGGGVIRSGASDLLRTLAERVKAPVTTTLMGIGGFPEDHPLSLGMLGMHGTPYANLAVQECDVLIGLGVRFDDRVTAAVEHFAPRAKVVHVDIDPAEIGKNVLVDLPIVGDLRLVLTDLLELVEEKDHQEWLDTVYAWRRERPLAYGSPDVLRPQYVLAKLGELTRHRAIITTDVGQHQMWTAQHYGFVRPGSFLTSGGLGTMGYGFPAALGAQLGAPDTLVIAVTGDGSFQMHMAEMATAVQEGLPVKILLFNNNSLGMVRQLQHFFCNRRYTAVDMVNPDFMKLAECYGAAGLRIQQPAEVEPVLTEAINNGRLTIIECIISDTELVYPVVPGTKGLHEMIEYTEEN